MVFKVFPSAYMYRYISANTSLIKWSGSLAFDSRSVDRNLLEDL